MGTAYRADLFAALRSPRASQLGLKVFQEKAVVSRVQMIEQFLWKVMSVTQLGKQSLETPTNNIVAKLITNQSEDQRFALATWVIEERFKNASSPVIVREHDAFLNDIAGIPVATECAQIAPNDGEDKLSVFLGAVLDDMLNDVISILLGNEIRDAILQLVHDCSLVRR